MSTDTLRLATRQSPLALWQAQHVAERLRQAHPGLQVELVPMLTQGDKILDSPLAKIGGKGLFVKELEQGLLAGRADLAVHSMKDVPAQFPPGLCLAVVLESADARDALVSAHYTQLDALPPTARIGTSSLRRQCQLRARYPQWQIAPLRGNLGSRLAKLDSGEFDAIILAVAGLQRLGLQQRIAAALEPECSLPAIGQGVIGVECRSDDVRTLELLAVLDHAPTRVRITAERAFNARLQGGCQAPIAGHALLQGEQIWLRGLVGTPDGRTLIVGEQRAAFADAELLGTALAEQLLERGAAAILRELLG